MMMGRLGTVGIHENITPGRWPINGAVEESRPGRRREMAEGGAAIKRRWAAAQSHVSVSVSWRGGNYESKYIFIYLLVKFSQQYNNYC